MINKELLGLTDKLSKAVDDQKNKANQALNSLPEGETKTKLGAILKKASSGNLTMEDAIHQLNKIQENAR